MNEIENLIINFDNNSNSMKRFFVRCSAFSSAPACCRMLRKRPRLRVTGTPLKCLSFLISGCCCRPRGLEVITTGTRPTKLGQSQNVFAARSGILLKHLLWRALSHCCRCRRHCPCDSRYHLALSPSVTERCSAIVRCCRASSTRASLISHTRLSMVSTKRAGR